MANSIVVVVKGVVLYKGLVLIVQRAQSEKIGKGTWECVGGKIEFGEELESALKREIKEESGLNVKVEKILYASTFTSNPSRQFVVLTYLCRSDDNTVSLSKEHMDYCWVTKDQLRLLLAPNIIRDFEKNHVFSLVEWQ
ncbi:NUDIX domain-containing protein [Bacillus sp. EB600]|uniref:NUDIX hydrolase n=1 Tax=Bacillus sp. EB600 TaxID=2806345 RepID=UPI0021092345|nr:NUDIX domain-containing protein [Bacillus sp. EB600]MCQ6279256.1 NUDIX domain-containing protein [Bacillus sp. EB600]